MFLIASPHVVIKIPESEWEGVQRSEKQAHERGLSTSDTTEPCTIFPCYPCSTKITTIDTQDPPPNMSLLGTTKWMASESHQEACFCWQAVITGMKGEKIKSWSIRQEDSTMHLWCYQYFRVVTSEEQTHGKLNCLNIFIKHNKVSECTLNTSTKKGMHYHIFMSLITKFFWTFWKQSQAPF